jgi:hypothetical protein
MMNALLSGAESLRASADLAKRIRDCADPAELRKSHETLLAARELLDDSISPPNAPFFGQQLSCGERSAADSR